MESQFLSSQAISRLFIQTADYFRGGEINTKVSPCRKERIKSRKFGATGEEWKVSTITHSHSFYKNKYYIEVQNYVNMFLQKSKLVYYIFLLLLQIINSYKQLK